MDRVLKEGDIVYLQQHNKFQLNKVVKIGEDPQLYHTILYKPIDVLPSLSELDSLEIYLWEISVNAFPDYEYLTNVPVKKEELKGYYEFLKQTNFKKYAEETKQDVKDIAARAILAFNRGTKFCGVQNFSEAIKEFDEALDLFPMFYEALDNKGFSYMDLGEWNNAIACFEGSLAINPRNFIAEFSIGECFYHSGNFQKALSSFKRALSIEPENVVGLEWLENTRKKLEGII